MSARWFPGADSISSQQLRHHITPTSVASIVSPSALRSCSPSVAIGFTHDVGGRTLPRVLAYLGWEESLVQYVRFLFGGAAVMADIGGIVPAVDLLSPPVR